MALLVLTGGQATRETNSVTISLLGEAIHVRAARVGQAEEAPHLIESLAGRVVQGAAQLDDVRRDVTDFEDVGVAARDHQANKVWRQRALRKLIDGQVPDDVVDAV